jgi:hypothetical protein
MPIAALSGSQSALGAAANKSAYALASEAELGAGSLVQGVVSGSVVRVWRIVDAWIADATGIYCTRNLEWVSGTVAFNSATAGNSVRIVRAADATRGFESLDDGFTINVALNERGLSPVTGFRIDAPAALPTGSGGGGSTALNSGERFITATTTNNYFRNNGFFPAKLGQEPNTLIVSDPITLRGTGSNGLPVNDPNYQPPVTHLSTNNGETRVNGGAWLSGVQPVNEGAVLEIRATTGSLATSGQAYVQYMRNTVNNVNAATYFRWEVRNNGRAPQLFSIGAGEAMTDLNQAFLDNLVAGDIVEFDDSKVYGPAYAGAILNTVGQTLTFTEWAPGKGWGFEITTDDANGQLALEQFVSGSWTALIPAEGDGATTGLINSTGVPAKPHGLGYGANPLATSIRVRVVARTAGSWNFGFNFGYTTPEYATYFLRRSGLPGLPITFRKKASSLTRPKLSNGTNGSGGIGSRKAVLWCQQANYIDVRSLEFLGDQSFAGTGILLGNNAGNQAHEIRVTDCVFEDTRDPILGFDNGCGRVEVTFSWFIRCGDGRFGPFGHSIYHGGNVDQFPTGHLLAQNNVIRDGRGNGIKTRMPARIHDNIIQMDAGSYVTQFGTEPIGFYPIECPQLQEQNSEYAHRNYGDITGNLLVCSGFGSNILKLGADRDSPGRWNANFRVYKNTIILQGGDRPGLSVGQAGMDSVFWDSNLVITVNNSAVTDRVLFQVADGIVWKDGIKIRYTNNRLPSTYIKTIDAAYVSAIIETGNITTGGVTTSNFTAPDITPTGAVIGAGTLPSVALPTGYDLPTGVLRTDFSTRVWTTYPANKSTLTAPVRASLSNIGAI